MEDTLASPSTPPVLRRSALLVAFALGGGLFGFAVSSIPSPADVGTFWVGNFSSPWAVLAFLAGWSQRSRAWAAGTGLMAEIACVTGFYARFVSADPLRLGLPLGTPGSSVLAASASNWLSFVAPWMVLAVGAGITYGLFGWWWGQSRSIVAGAAVAVPFVVEPLLWPLRNGYFQGPIIVWVAEAAVGLIVLVWVGAVWQRSRQRSAQLE